jgi:hypothetical protein
LAKQIAQPPQQEMEQETAQQNHSRGKMELELPQ